MNDVRAKPSTEVQASALRREALEKKLSTRRYGRSMEVHETVDSTMDLAQEACRRGAADGHIVWADAQRSGRGTRGRAWLSPPGEDLYLSLVARPGLTLAELPPITLAAGLAVADAIATIGDYETDAVRIKWPNDVWIARKKCAGILVESSSVGESPEAVIIGIGINVNRRFIDEEIAASATSMSLSSAGMRRFDRVALLASLLDRLESWIDVLATRGTSTIAGALEPRLALLGEPARVDTRDGVVRGVDAQGALLFETQYGLEHLQAGRLEPLVDPS